MTRQPATHACYDVVVNFITTESERYSVRYCPRGAHLMAKSTSKTILFATARHDKKVYQHPVAVFNNADDAKRFATYLRLAHRASDKDAAVALDPKTHLTPEGDLIADTKWSIAEVAYAPEPNLGDEEDAATEASSN